VPFNLLHAVIGPKVCPPPSARGTPATPFNICQRFVRLKAINRQFSRMMAGPIALALSKAIDK
jgi:hypothetical protein